MILPWITAVAAAYCILFAIQIPLRKLSKWWIALISLVLKAALATGLAFLCLGVSFVMPLVITLAFGVLYIALWGDAAADLILIILLLAKKKYKPVPIHICGIALSLLYLTYAFVNMQITVPNYHNYSSGKLSHDYKIVFFSDLHYGSAQSKDSVMKTLSKIRNESPDLIILGGDITDEYTSPDELDFIYEQLGSMGIPVYFIYGNHDYMTVSNEGLVNVLESNGIRILRDSEEFINDDLVLLGRDDITSSGRVPVKELPELPEDRYVICIDHSPYQYDDIAAGIYDVQLSGHVHAGQLFPLQFVYDFAEDNIYGAFRIGSTDLYVTSGVSGWCFPLRTEEHSYYEVISLSGIME